MPRLDNSLPDWVIEPLEDSDDALINCSKCTHGTIVNLPAWLNGRGSSKGGRGRPCTYCCMTSVVPKDYGVEE